MVDVKIVSATKFSMSGEIITTSIPKAPRRPSPPLRGALSQPPQESKGESKEQTACCGDKTNCSLVSKKKDDCSSPAAAAAAAAAVRVKKGEMWEKVSRMVVLVALVVVGLILLFRILFW